MPRNGSLAAIAFASALLSACGGGGGGSNIREVPFTSFAAVQPNEAVVMQGTSQTASGSLTTSSGGGFDVTSANLNPVQDGTLKLTYGATGAISSIDFSTPSASASFVGATCASGVCSAETASSVAVVIDARAAVVGWNYQTFGIWFQQNGPSTFNAGAMSAGAVTPANAAPISGTANFTGRAAGFYVNSLGVPFATAANMTASVDFSGSIAFATTGTTGANLNTGAALSNPTNLNLNGTWTYTPGSSQFSGNVTTFDGRLTGSATGRFYGPATEEMGGTYQLSAAGPNERMIGGFGAKKQ